MLWVKIGCNSARNASLIDLRDSDMNEALTRIREEIRLVGATGKILQLFEGIGGPLKLEPDCLGVVGRLITDRMAGAQEAVEEISASLEAKR